MLPAKLTDLAQTHLNELVATRATEGWHLDFKRELPAVWDYEAKKRFIADVTAFANGGGGDIVYGVDEDADAQATAVVPQAFESVDAEVRRLQDLVLTLAEPRLPGVQVQAVAVATDAAAGHAIVVRVPQSWAAPHRSRVNQHFYVRDGLRNRQLEVPEIRALFVRSDSQAQRMREFRTERLAKVVTGQTPVRLQGGPMLVVHAMSAGAALGQADLDPLLYTRGRRPLPVIGTLPASPVSLNLDGAFAPIVARGNPPGYIQQFRHGYFEAVWELSAFPDSNKPVLPGVIYESYVNNFLQKVRGEFADADISPELAVFLSLVGADRAVLSAPSQLGPGFPGEMKPFDRKDVLLPDVVIPPESSIGRGMRPAYDLMNQAAGFEQSLNYDAQGEWVGRS